VCCFILLSRGWGRLETRSAVTLGTSPELSCFYYVARSPRFPSMTTSRICFYHAQLPLSKNKLLKGHDGAAVGRPSHLAHRRRHRCVRVCVWVCRSGDSIAFQSCAAQSESHQECCAKKKRLCVYVFKFVGERWISCYNDDSIWQDSLPAIITTWCEMLFDSWGSVSHPPPCRALAAARGRHRAPLLRPHESAGPLPPVRTQARVTQHGPHPKEAGCDITAAGAAIASILLIRSLPRFHTQWALPPCHWAGPCWKVCRLPCSRK